jgi:hypothetical protein
MNQPIKAQEFARSRELRERAEEIGRATGMIISAVISLVLLWFIWGNAHWSVAVMLTGLAVSNFVKGLKR